jgi:hypothetical protein
MRSILSTATGKRGLGALALVAVGVAAAPSMAASSRTLYFGNARDYNSGTCTPDYVLTPTPLPNRPCAHVQAGDAGHGSFASETYTATVNGVRFRLDTSRPVVGTIYLVNNAPVTLYAVATPSTTPGPAAARIRVQVNGTTVGEVAGSGVAGLNGAVAVPVDLKLPVRMNRTLVTSISVLVQFTGALGATTVSYRQGSQSTLAFPAR